MMTGIHHIMTEGNQKEEKFGRYNIVGRRLSEMRTKVEKRLNDIEGKK